LAWLFLDVESSAINAVVNHRLLAHDLYLLDPRIQDVEPSYIFNGFTSTFEASTGKFREYTTLDTILFPLHSYFAILLAHNSSAYGLSAYLFLYLTHIQVLAADYEWEAVLKYHTLFFNRQSHEMEVHSDYSAWFSPIFIS
ncbi:hypothetical protein B0H10DRAFT_1840333, partial [Mycena sp. CBHHK59/15]